MTFFYCVEHSKNGKSHNRTITAIQYIQILGRRCHLIKGIWRWIRIYWGLPTSIQAGGTIRHFCLCFRFRANHRGTSTGRPGLKGPRSPYQKQVSKQHKSTHNDNLTSQNCLNRRNNSFTNRLPRLKRPCPCWNWVLSLSSLSRRGILLQMDP